MKALTRAPGAGGGSSGEGEVPPRRAPRQRFTKLVAALAAIAAALTGRYMVAQVLRGGGSHRGGARRATPITPAHPRVLAL